MKAQPRRRGGIGRHAVLRGQWEKSRGSSSLPVGTGRACEWGRGYGMGLNAKQKSKQETKQKQARGQAKASKRLSKMLGEGFQFLFSHGGV